MRKEMSPEEDEVNLDKVQKSLDEVVKTYKKNQDESELKKSLKEIKKEAESLDLDLLKGAAIKKLETQIVSEHKLNKDKPIAPPRTKKGIKKNDPVFDLRKALEKPAPKKSEGTHKMPDGTVMSGETHSADSVEVKPVETKPKLKIKKKVTATGTKLKKGVADKAIKKIEAKKEKEDLIKKTAESNLKGKERKDELEQRLANGDNIEVWDSDTGVLPSGSKTNKFAVFKRSWEAKGFKVIKKDKPKPAPEKEKPAPEKEKPKQLDIQKSIADFEESIKDWKQFLKDFKMGKTKFGGKIKLEDYEKEKIKLKNLLSNTLTLGNKLVSQDIKNESDFYKDLVKSFISERNKITRLYNKAKTRFNNLSYLLDYGGEEPKK